VTSTSESGIEFELSGDMVEINKNEKGKGKKDGKVGNDGMNTPDRRKFGVIKHHRSQKLKESLNGAHNDEFGERNKKDIDNNDQISHQSRHSTPSGTPLVLPLQKDLPNFQLKSEKKLKKSDKNCDKNNNDQFNDGMSTPTTQPSTQPSTPKNKDRNSAPTSRPLTPIYASNNGDTNTSDDFSGNIPNQNFDSQHISFFNDKASDKNDKHDKHDKKKSKNQGSEKKSKKDKKNNTPNYQTDDPTDLNLLPSSRPISSGSKHHPTPKSNPLDGPSRGKNGLGSGLSKGLGSPGDIEGKNNRSLIYSDDDYDMSRLSGTFMLNEVKPKNEVLNRRSKVVVTVKPDEDEQGSDLGGNKVIRRSGNVENQRGKPDQSYSLSTQTSFNVKDPFDVNGGGNDGDGNDGDGNDGDGKDLNEDEIAGVLITSPTFLTKHTFKGIDTFSQISSDILSAGSTNQIGMIGTINAPSLNGNLANKNRLGDNNLNDNLNNPNNPSNPNNPNNNLKNGNFTQKKSNYFETSIIYPRIVFRWY